MQGRIESVLRVLNLSELSGAGEANRAGAFIKMCWDSPRHTYCTHVLADSEPLQSQGQSYPVVVVALPLMKQAAREAAVRLNVCRD